MRTAVCLSGFLRACEASYESLNKFIFERFKPDIFISTWDQDGQAGQLQKTAVDMYRPKAIEIQSWPEVLASWGDLAELDKRKRADVTVANVLGMFYKIYRSNQLKRAAESSAGVRYDAVVRLRTDLLFYDAPDLRGIIPGYVAIGNTFGYGGLPDLFAYGDSGSMDVYSDLFPRIRSYVNEGCIFHPEILLEWHTKRALPQGVVFSNVPFRLNKPTGASGPNVWCIR